MNKHVLNTTIQKFIDKNIKSDISDLLLKGFSFEGLSQNEIIEQIEAKKRCEKKLPTWYSSKNIYYPNKINIEQTSSEATANYKANLVSGNSLIDLTGGFGVDSYFFSKQIKEVTHCEIDTELSLIASHNFNVLSTTNITTINNSGIEALKQLNKSFNWIYIDPSRRDDTKRKVFLLSDCSPNVKVFQGLFLKYAKNVMIKTSPLLDIKATSIDLTNVKELHVLALNNEVKELLWVLERNYIGEFNIKTVNLKKSHNESFEFNYHDEVDAVVKYNWPMTYLYEPNSAVLKSGAFNSASARLNVGKLHKHSHLYTSEHLIEFPGRRFKIVKVLPFNKKIFAKEKINKANVTARNFPLVVGDIRKKLKIRDGGDTYLFFTTDKSNSKIIIQCSKV